MYCIVGCVHLQSVGSGLSLEPPATTEADEEEDGMSDIIQEVKDIANTISLLTVVRRLWCREHGLTVFKPFHVNCLVQGLLSLNFNIYSPSFLIQVTGLIWSQDLRIQEVRRLLQSSRPVRVSVVQLPEVSDHEYIEEKENK